MMLKNISIYLLIAFLLVSTASAELPAESAEISYQVEHSDRIAIGNVTEIQKYYDHSVVTVEVHEWLMNPIAATEIKIQTEIGTNVELEDEPRFAVNETAIFMLRETDPENNTFRVTVGEPGKHPLSDRNAIVNEIEKMQGLQDYTNEKDNDFVKISTMLPLMVFFASILFVFVLVKKAVKEPNSKKTYLTFFLIGILTFYLSGYILRGIHPPESVYLMILVYFVLTGIGILASGKRSGMFIAKAFAISFAALIIISVLFFAYGAFSHMYSKSIDADLLSEKPDNFIVVTDEELKSYPALKEAIETQSPVDANPREWERTIEFLNGTYEVQYEDKYYGIGFMTA